MCPFCLANLAMVVAGAASTGGVAAVLTRTFRYKRRAKKTSFVGNSEWNQQKEKGHEQENCR
jgi:hypothetical protein